MKAKQELFCQEFITDLNATQAAIRAGYSEDSASQQASRLLSIVKIQDYVAELRKPILERAEVTLQSHLERLKDLSLMAEAAGQYGVAVKAEIERGKASGLYTNKSEITGKGFESPTINFIPKGIDVVYE